MKIGMNMLLWTTFVNEEYFPMIEKIKKAGAFSRHNEEFANGINVWRNYQDDFNEVYEQGYTFIRNSWNRYA